MRKSQLLYREILASSLTFYSGRLNRGAQGARSSMFVVDEEGRGYLIVSDLLNSVHVERRAVLYNAAYKISCHNSCNSESASLSASGMGAKLCLVLFSAVLAVVAWISTSFIPWKTPPVANFGE